MEQTQQVSLDEIFATMGDLYFKLQLAQKEIMRLREKSKNLKEQKEKPDK